MGILEKILSRKGYFKGLPMSWMTWKGDCNSPGFTIKLDSMSGLREAYCKCSPVSTIINRTASSLSNGKWWIVDEKNNDSSKRYKNISDLIKKPNPLQTRTEFIIQTDAYRSLYGITHVYAVVPEGFSSVSDATALWPINPERIEPIFKKDIIYFAQSIEDIIEKYVITINGSTIDVNPRHILTIRDSFGDISYLNRNKNTSRIGGLHYEIRNIIQAQEAIYSLNKDRGAQGIITNKTKDASGNVPFSPTEKEKIQSDYQRKFGLNEYQSKVIITDSDLGWLPLSFNVRDLMLYEGIKQNIESVSDALNYPFELLANQKGTTFANRSEAIKYLYQDNVIPTSRIYEEKFTEFLDLENAVISIDFSDVEYLKEAEKEKADALLKMNQALQIPYKLKVITKEEYRVLLDMDEKPKGTTYYTEENGSKVTGQS